MGFTEVLNPKAIVTHLKVDNKAEAFDAMAEMLVNSGNVTDKEQYIKDVYEREAIGETGVGNYIAIPHGRSEAVVKPGVAIAILDHEIPWESLDGTGAKIVVLFAVGADNEAAMEHLRLLAMFSRRLGDDTVIRKLLQADSVEEVMQAFMEDENAEEEDTEEADLDLDEIEIM